MQSGLPIGCEPLPLAPAGLRERGRESSGLHRKHPDPPNISRQVHAGDTTTPSHRPYTLSTAPRPFPVCSEEPLRAHTPSPPIFTQHNGLHRRQRKPLLRGEALVDCARHTISQLTMRGDAFLTVFCFRSSVGALSPSVSSTASHTRPQSRAKTRLPPRSTTTSARRSSSATLGLHGQRRTRPQALAVDVSATLTIHGKRWDMDRGMDRLHTFAKDDCRTR